MTPQVRAYALRAPDWSDLPIVNAGAHLTVPVRLPDGTVVSRQYSLTTHPQRRDMYEIAVLREEAGRGGSAAIHAIWQIGTRFALDPPVNLFPLHDDDRPAILIAGGIGITPIKAMAHTLKARGTAFELHYSSRTPAEMTYRDCLAIEFSDQLHLYFTRTTDGNRLDIEAIMNAASPDTMFYVCGSVRLIEAVINAAGVRGMPCSRVQYERFE